MGRCLDEIHLRGFFYFCARWKQNYNYKNPLDREQRQARWQIVKRFMLIFSATVADGFAFISKKFPPANWNLHALYSSGYEVRSNDIDTCFTFQMHQRRSRCFHCFNYGNLSSLARSLLLFQHKLFSTQNMKTIENSLGGTRDLYLLFKAGTGRVRKQE